MFYRKFHKKEMNILDIESEILGIDHTKVGGILAKRWSFAESLASIVQFHHQPNRSTEHKNLLTIVYLADLLMMQFNSSLELERLDTESLDIYLQGIGLSVDQYQELVDLIPLKVFESPSDQAMV